jgi:hypothetical protein
MFCSWCTQVVPKLAAHCAALRYRMLLRGMIAHNVNTCVLVLMVWCAVMVLQRGLHRLACTGKCCSLTAVLCNYCTSNSALFQYRCLTIHHRFVLMPLNLSIVIASAGLMPDDCDYLQPLCMYHQHCHAVDAKADVVLAVLMRMPFLNNGMRR